MANTLAQVNIHLELLVHSCCLICTNRLAPKRIVCLQCIQMLLGSLTKPMRTLSSNKLRLHTSGFLLVNFGHMPRVYSHLFHLIENSDLVYLRYSLFGNYYDYTLVAILNKLSYEVWLVFLKCPPLLSFKLYLIGRSICRIWVLEVINIMQS